MGVSTLQMLCREWGELRVERQWGGVNGVCAREAEAPAPWEGSQHLPKFFDADFQVLDDGTQCLAF
jgi:hypothetical protein